VFAIRPEKFVTRVRTVACLLALAFLALQTTALTHELRHDLHQHDDISCVLHLYADHLDKTAASAGGGVVAIAQHDVQLPADIRPVVLQQAFNYHVRAPPLSSVRSI
jgi:hypothetical protein